MRSSSADRLVRLAGRHAGGRLVEQQQLRVAGQREAQLELLLVAVAQACRRACGAWSRKPDLAQQRFGLVAIERLGARPEIAAAPAMGDERRLHVLEHGQLREDVGALERAAHAHAADLVRRTPVMSRPSSSTRPLSGRRCPVIRLNSVDLPAPLGPITAAICRGLDGQADTSATATKPAKDLREAARPQASPPPPAGATAPRRARRRMPPGNTNSSTTRIVPSTNGQYSV